MKVSHYRPTWAEIHLSHLAFNFKQLQKKIGPQVGVMAIIKANAYGHGDVAVAEVLQKLGVSFLAVAYVEEGMHLREAGIRSPIVVLTGGQDPKVFQALRTFKLTPVIYSETSLKAYDQFCRSHHQRGKVHLKFDTGMNRLGFPGDRAASLLGSLSSYKNIWVEGMMTHLANAERRSHYNQEQILMFRRWVKQHGQSIPYKHIANSGFILNEFGIEENLVRPGLILYGAYPLSSLRSTMVLKPVMSLKSRIIQLKAVHKGDYIGYGYTHRFKKDSWVATLAVGYADGWLRYLSNRGEVLIRGCRAPMVGMVCMDVFMVDVGHVPNVGVGDEATLIGNDQDQAIFVEEIAERIGTIPWEIFCQLTSRIPRITLK